MFSVGVSAAHQGDVGEPHNTHACSQVEVVSAEVDTKESLFCMKWGEAGLAGKAVMAEIHSLLVYPGKL